MRYKEQLNECQRNVSTCAGWFQRGNMLAKVIWIGSDYKYLPVIIPTALYSRESSTWESWNPNPITLYNHSTRFEGKLREFWVHVYGLRVCDDDDDDGAMFKGRKRESHDHGQLHFVPLTKQSLHVSSDLRRRPRRQSRHAAGCACKYSHHFHHHHHHQYSHLCIYIYIYIYIYIHI